MFKIIGAIMIVGAASVVGLSSSARLTARHRHLLAISRALNIMRSEISELYTPLDELISKLGNLSPVPLSTFFKDCFVAIKSGRDTPFGIIWAKEISRATYLELHPAERQALSELGGVLGRYSAEEQSRAISHTVRTIDAAALTAASECSKLGRLYGRLGIICGIAIVIVFI